MCCSKLQLVSKNDNRTIKRAVITSMSRVVFRIRLLDLEPFPSAISQMIQSDHSHVNPVFDDVPLQCVTVCLTIKSVVKCVAVRCSVLQCVAVRCSVLQCV